MVRLIVVFSSHFPDCNACPVRPCTCQVSIQEPQFFGRVMLSRVVLGKRGALRSLQAGVVAEDGEGAWQGSCQRSEETQEQGTQERRPCEIPCLPGRGAAHLLGTEMRSPRI